MKSHLIAIILTFENKFNNKIFNIWKILDKKYNIRYLSTHSPKPHLTLISGQTKSKERLIEKLNKIKIHRFRLRKIGLGIFANREPLLYLRWEVNDILSKIQKKIRIKFKNFFFKNLNNQRIWIPKTSIAYKDFNYKKMDKILENLNYFNKKEHILVRKIEVLEINKKKGEKIIYSKSL